LICIVSALEFRFLLPVFLFLSMCQTAVQLIPPKFGYPIPGYSTPPVDRATGSPFATLTTTFGKTCPANPILLTKTTVDGGDLRLNYYPSSIKDGPVSRI
jgi:hypothetical protein